VRSNQRRSVVGLACLLFDKDRISRAGECLVAARRDFWWFLGIRCRRADWIPGCKISDE